MANVLPQRLQFDDFSTGTVQAADGYSLKYRHYAATGPAKGVLACTHGIQSHAGWYPHSCQAWAKAGYDVYFIDRRGSGANEQDRGFSTGVSQLCDDLRRYVEHVRAAHGELPVTLLGISWGGKLAVATLKQYPKLADALILACPGLFAKVQPTLREKLAIGWSALLWPKRQIRIPLSEPALFTANDEFQKYIANDPKALKQGSARLLMSSRFLDAALTDAPPKITVPTLLLLAGKDRIIDNSKTRAFVERFAAKERKIVEYPDAHHTLEFEADPQFFIDDVTEWLDATVATERSATA